MIRMGVGDENALHGFGGDIVELQSVAKALAAYPCVNKDTAVLVADKGGIALA